VRSALLDTGFLVALLDRSERNHERCVDELKAYSGELLTTEPVLTESLYLLGPSVKAQKACIEFLLRGGAVLVPQSAASLSRAAALMEKYQDVPMDFADANARGAGGGNGAEEVFTLDRKGFAAYRIQGRKGFSVRPG